MFDAILIEKPEDGDQTVSLTQLEPDALPEGDVRVAVAYSTLNYKDALAITGRGPVVRKFPMVPGIDFAGVIEQSESPDYKPGDEVVLTGWQVGDRAMALLAGGGYAEQVLVPALAEPGQEPLQPPDERPGLQHARHQPGLGQRGALPRRVHAHAQAPADTLGVVLHRRPPPRPRLQADPGCQRWGEG